MVAVPTEDVPASVLEAVARWAHAPDAASAISALRDGWIDLAPAERPLLAGACARVCVATLIVGMGDEGLTVFLDAWQHDQREVGRVLGVPETAWTELIRQELATAKLAGAPLRLSPLRALAERRSAFLGEPGSSFENPPTPGTSAQAGLRGLLALRDFSRPAGDTPDK